MLALPAAAVAANPAGLWEGSLTTPNGDLGMVFNLHQDGDHWAAELDVPMQGVSELPLSNVKVDSASVGFDLPGPGNPHYDGKLSDDGKTIAGNLSGAAGTMQLNLKWKSEARAVSKTQPNSGDVQILEGTWDGTLDANGTTLHLRFNFVKNADGSLKGTIDSLDQGANGLPISSISRSGDTVKLDLKIISGSYEATLNKEASAMSGTFTQGGASLPLAMQRKKADSKN